MSAGIKDQGVDTHILMMAEYVGRYIPTDFSAYAAIIDMGFINNGNVYSGAYLHIYWDKRKDRLVLIPRWKCPENSYPQFTTLILYTV